MGKTHNSLMGEFLVRAICETYYRNQPGRGTNYEDYYYVLSQINDSELGEFDNPAVQSMIDYLRSRVEQIVASARAPGVSRWRFEEIFQESANYIEDVSRHMLNHQPANLHGHLQFLIHAIEEKSVVNIFTLNHDTIIEQTLAQAGVVYNDGFGKQAGDLRYWQPELFDRLVGSPRLFKLHGSIGLVQSYS